MLLTPHTFVGLAVGSTISNPLISAPLSFFLHFAGDLVPHWDFYSETSKEDRTKGWRPIAVMADLVVGVSVGLISTLYVLWVKHDSTLALSIFLAGICSVLPDALTAPEIFMKKPPALSRYLGKIQSRLQFQAPLPWGIISQVIVMALSALLFYRNLF